MIKTLELFLCEYSLKNFVEILKKVIGDGMETIHIHPVDDFGNRLIQEIRKENLKVRFLTDDALNADVTVLLSTDPDVLSQDLMTLVNKDHGVVVASQTSRYYRNCPIFLISIPKSGTHLLYDLVENFGYGRGVVCPETPQPATWYCVEYSNSHTSARDFFIDSVRRSPFGNRDHPFLRSPAIFMYRNPLDIVISEANYYHKEGNTAFFPYLKGKSFEERLLTLIDDPWLLGSFRDRMAGFVPWLEFQNVIPVSFEELVGAQGGGNDEVQKKVIWSLQLKLHVPGNPSEFGQKVFNRDSPTFFSGKIGENRKQIAPEAMFKFQSLPQDFMDAFGYDRNSLESKNFYPSRAEVFRNRPLVFAANQFDSLPITVEYDFLKYNIVKFGNFYYGIPLGTSCDFSVPNFYEQTPGLIKGSDTNMVKSKIVWKSINPSKWFCFNLKSLKG